MNYRYYNSNSSIPIPLMVNKVPPPILPIRGETLYMPVIKYKAVTINDDMITYVYVCT